MRPDRSPPKQLSTAVHRAVEIATSKAVIAAMALLVMAWMVIGYTAVLTGSSYRNVEASVLWRIFDWGTDVFATIGASAIVYRWFWFMKRK